MGARTASVSLALLLLTAAFMLAKTGRDALYVQAGGIYDLPKGYLGVSLLSIPAAAVMLGLMRLFGTRAARVVAILATAASLALVARTARPGGGSLMTGVFVLIPLAFGILFSAGWLLAADLLDRASSEQLARSYTLIATSSTLGGTLGSVLARALANRVEPQALFLFAAALLGGAAILVATAHRICPRNSYFRAGAPVLPKGDDFRLVFSNDYTRLLFWIALVGALAGVLVEFQFYLLAASSGNSGRANASFFSKYYLILNGTSLLLQILILPRLLRRFGADRNLFVLPTALLGGAAALVTSAAAFLPALLRVAEGSIKSSIHRVSWEQVYLPLSGAQRTVAKTFADGLGVHAAEALAAMILSVWLHFTPASRQIASDAKGLIGWLLLAVAVLWLALTRAVGRSRDEVLQGARTREMANLGPRPDT